MAAHAPVVTLSAPYGTGGSEIGPRLADALGVPFLDRAIPTEVAGRLACPLDRAVEQDESVPSTLDRLLRSFAALGPAFTGTPPIEDLGDRSFADATEAVLRERAASGCVVLGRAGAVVLREHPGALHVRLRGSPERRIAQAMVLEGVDRRTAERRRAEVDAARDAYVRHFYGRDPADPDLYHLLIDSTALSIDGCVAVIVAALRALRGPA